MTSSTKSNLTQRVFHIVAPLLRSTLPTGIVRRLLPPPRLVPRHLLLLFGVEGVVLGDELVGVLELLHLGRAHLHRFHGDDVGHWLHVFLEVDADVAADAGQEVDLLQFLVGGLFLGAVAVGALRVLDGVVGAGAGASFGGEFFGFADEVDLLHEDLVSLWMERGGNC